MPKARAPIAPRILQTHLQEGDCWIWTGSSTRDGYGVLTVGRKQFRAHRASYEAFNGPIPDGAVVRHSCDTPLCVNPAHLSVGTHKANTADMDARGRRGKPTNHPLWKISQTDRRLIRNRRVQGETLSSIASDYGVSFQTISDICIGRRNYADA